MSQTLKQVEKKFHRIAQIDHATTFLGWDQMVKMPDAGIVPRSTAIAELASMRHELLSSDALGDWLSEIADDIKNGLQDASEDAHIKEMQRAWHQARALPSELVHAQVIAGSKCEHGWRTQKETSDWSGFLENFREVVALSREEAQCRQAKCPEDFETPYDALLDLHCTGDSHTLIARVFGELKRSLPALLEQIKDKQHSRAYCDLKGNYAIAQQQKLSEHLMSVLGFDFNAGRLDISVHPFSTGVRGDQRITTRYRTSDFADALQATAHETGHASYEAGLPERWQSFPVGLARNMCIHESQSLFFEKQIFLSRSFGKFFTDAIHKHLPATQAFDADDIWHSQTRVQASFIRTEADEVTYPLHVMLRYDIERALINGDIEPDMIPDMWESLLNDYLGLSTGGDHAMGCMQDIHWTDGSFGYFPSYTMGAVNAAQMAANVKNQFGDWNERLASGDISFAREWLHDHVWHHASFLNSQNLMKSATGQGSSASFFLEHLKSRYLDEVD